MDENQLNFLKSIQDLDWTSFHHEQGKNVAAKKSNVSAIKMSKGQKKRTKKKFKKNLQGENSAASKGVETVVFQNPDVDFRISTASSNQKHKRANESPCDGIEIDLKKARFEVMKFGMNSMSGSEKHDAETTLAMSLGAKPEKRPYINYKEFQVTRKHEKQQILEQELIQAKAKPKLKKTKHDKKKPRKADDGVVRVKNVKNITKNTKKVVKQRK